MLSLVRHGEQTEKHVSVNGGLLKNFATLLTIKLLPGISQNRYKKKETIGASYGINNSI